MKYEQLTIFDFLEPADHNQSFSLRQTVRIKKANELVNPDSETVSYLSDYKFGGQVGTIIIVVTGKVTSYYVETKIGIAVVTEEELAFIS